MIETFLPENASPNASVSEAVRNVAAMLRRQHGTDAGSVVDQLMMFTHIEGSGRGVLQWTAVRRQLGN